MIKTAVLIATTNGPVCVERITPEPAPQSMICLSRQSRVLPISGDYDDFVRPGSGIITREFGPFAEDALRLDLSAPVETGNSWQLGVYCAHAIDHSPRHELSALEEADLILWATGTVDYDLNVGFVHHIEEKVAASLLVLAQALTDKKPIQFLCDPQNAAHLQDNQPPAGITVKSLATVRDLLAQVDPDFAHMAPPQPKPQTAPGQGGNKSFFVLATLCASAIAGIGLFQYFSHQAQIPTEDKLSETSLSLSTQRGDNTEFRYGENLKLYLTANKDIWPYCFYQQVDGQTFALYPNPQAPLTHPLQANQRHELTQAFDLRLGPPAGEETVTCYASPHQQNHRFATHNTGFLTQQGLTDITRLFDKFPKGHLKITVTP